MFSANLFPRSSRGPTRRSFLQAAVSAPTVIGALRTTDLAGAQTSHARQTSSGVLTPGSGQRYGATYSARTTYGVVEESDGNLYRSVAPNKGNPPATDKGRYWELWSVVNNVTLKIPNRFATIPDSLLFLKNARIGENVYVTIEVADGTYNYRSSVVLNHVFGARIRLLGNTQTPGNCVLSFIGDTDGLVALNGYRFGLIDGFKVVGTWIGSTSPGFPGGVPARSKAAILARYGAFIKLGTHLETDRFYYGVEASQGSTVVADGVKVTNAGDGGFFPYSGSTIRANNCGGELLQR